MSRPIDNLINVLNEITQLDVQLSNWVKEICKDREPDHGWQHMKDVATKSKEFFFNIFGCINEQNAEMFKKVMIVAWTHDICDHKMKDCEELKPKLWEFIFKIYPFEFNVLFEMTENISFSKEMKMRAGGFDPIGYWEGIFRENCIILKIVQDADRFFA